MADREIIIDLHANTDSATANVLKFRAENEKLTAATKKAKDELKELEKRISENGKATEEEAEQIKSLNTIIETNIVERKANNKAISDSQKVMQDHLAETKLQQGSLREMRQEVGSLTAVWENLSEVEREGARGQETQERLAELNSQINAASLSTKNFKDNIGNYRSALDDSTIESTKFGGVLKSVGVSSDTTAKSFKTNLVGGLKATGQAALKLLANPFFAMLAGITVVIMAIVKGIKSNQQAMDAFGKITAPVGRLLEHIFDILGKVAEGIGKVITGFMNLFGAAENAAVKAIDLRIELEEQEIELIKSRAEESLKIAEIENMQAEKHKYSHEERIKMAEEIAEIREKQAKEDEERAKRELELWDLQNAHTVSTREDYKERAEIEAKYLQAQAKRIKESKKQASMVDASRKAIEEETKAIQAQEAAAVQAFEKRIALQKQLEGKTAQELEDLLVSIMEEGQQKEEEILRVNFERRIEDVKKRLLTEENLTVESRRNLNAILETLENEQEEKLSNLRERYRQAEIDAENEAEEIRKAQDQADSEAEYAEQLQIRADRAELELELRREELNNEMLLEQELALEQNDFLLNLDEEAKSEMFTSTEAYELAVLQSNRRLKKAHEETANAQWQAAQNQLIATGAVAGALSSMLSDLADEGSAGTEFAKALALVDIATNMGVGLAGAIKAGAGVPFPANLGAIAAGVGVVAAGIGGAKSALSKSKPKKPSILGAQKSTSISMPSVPTPSTPTATSAPIISELGAIDARGDAAAATAEQQTSPVVSIVDIMDAENAVKVRQQLADV